MFSSGVAVALNILPSPRAHFDGIERDAQLEKIGKTTENFGRSHGYFS